MSCSKQDLINARNQLSDNALKYFLFQPEVKAIFIAGSLAAGTTDEFSDIDLRVVVAHEDHQQFIASRLAAPKQWGDFLYNEWIKDAIHCVSHFKPFNKIDVFYFTPEHLQPSPWYSLPIQVIHDPEGLVKNLINASKDLPFVVDVDEVERLISKGLACIHEIYRRAMRGELFYAQSLLDQTRYCMIKADDYLSGHPPHGSGFAGFERRGTEEVIEAIQASYSPPEKQSLLNRLQRLLEVYRTQISRLHEMFSLKRDIHLDFYSLDLVKELINREDFNLR